jgi:hypothetical protein
MSRLMEAIADIWRRREYRKSSSVLTRLAHLATEGAGSTYSASLSFTLPHNQRHGAQYQISYSLTVHKRCKCVDLGECTSCYNGCALDAKDQFDFDRSRSWHADSEAILQMTQAVGRLPGLSHISISFIDDRGSSDDSSRKLDRKADDLIDRLLPVLRESLCSQGASSQLSRIELYIRAQQRRLPVLASDFLTLPGATPSLQSLKIFEYHNLHSRSISAPEDDAKSIASFLRANTSLRSLLFRLNIRSWAQILPALEIIMKPLRLSKALKHRHKQQGGDLVLQQLELELAVDDYGNAYETVKVMARVLDIAGLQFAVGEFSLSIYPFNLNFKLVMRIERGAFVELHVPRCNETGARAVEEALRLNRGPSVLSLDAHPPRVVRTILSPLIPDQNGHQANTSVSTLRLLNITSMTQISTVRLQQERLEEVANMMKSNSALDHLEVSSWYQATDPPSRRRYGLEYPQCSSNSPVVTQLQSRLRPEGNLRSFTFYGQHMGSDSAASVIAGDSTIQSFLPYIVYELPLLDADGRSSLCCVSIARVQLSQKTTMFVCEGQAASSKELTRRRWRRCSVGSTCGRTKVPHMPAHHDLVL